MEIEKKFLLRSLPEQLEQYEKKQIEQGYLCKAPVVRIRRSNDQYILTYKAKRGSSQGASEACCIHEEVELPLDEQSYLHLRDKVDGALVKKCRYLIPLQDGHTGELDVFEGCLKGLAFIEVEFEDEAAAQAFVPPEWFGENVSADRRFSNTFLSECNDLSAFFDIQVK